MRDVKKADTFQFKQFEIEQDKCPMKVGTDGVLLGAWADVKGVSQILDIGTGTGLIAIMLGQRTAEANIHAVEIDEEAFNQAKENMKKTSWANQLEVFHDSIQNYSKISDQKYGLIVSNPPFFSGGTFSTNQDRNKVRHTIKMPHGDLLTAVRHLLKPEGRFCVILPYIEGLRFQELAKDYNLYTTKVTQVLPKKDKSVERLLIQFEKVEKNMERSELIIQKENRNDWTNEYIDLTGDFYLKM